MSKDGLKAATKNTGTNRRFGRPPGVNSDDTRRRLLDAAKVVFAERGYMDASNKIIAAAAGMTTGAIYHYFPTKQSLFLAIHEELQSMQLDRFEPIVHDAPSLTSALTQLLSTIAQSRSIDPYASGFLSVMRVEARRNAEISAALDDHRWLKLFEDLAALGVKTGEVEPSHARHIRGVLSILLFGIAQHAAEATATGYRTAIEGLYHLINGNLVRRVAAASIS